MSWAAILVLGAGAYGFKYLGLGVLGPRAASGRALQFVALLPPALLAALVCVQTFGGDRALALDARVAGVAAGAIAVPDPRAGHPVPTSFAQRGRWRRRGCAFAGSQGVWRADDPPYPRRGCGSCETPTPSTRRAAVPP
jgi:hypothetical protein